MNRNQRGQSRVDVLVIIIVLAIGGSLASALFGRQKGDAAGTMRRTHEKSLKDANQMIAIHQAWVTMSREHNGVLPTPGLINRLAVNGQHVPGRGAEDKNANTTANLYSVCIMMNYFTPDLAISPVERNPNVKVDADYKYEAFNAINDVYWDATFVADLEKGSNASYAHQPIAGERAVKEWRDTTNANWPILGNRGPKGGLPDPSSYTCGPHGNWAGYIVFNDGHAQFSLSTIPHMDGADPDDNVFSPDTKGALITFTKEFVNDKPVYQFD